MQYPGVLKRHSQHLVNSQPLIFTHLLPKQARRYSGRPGFCQYASHFDRREPT